MSDHDKLSMSSKEQTATALNTDHGSTHSTSPIDPPKLDKPPTLEPTEKQVDENLIDWDGPEDPQNPKNWPTKRKWAVTLVTSAFTFLSPVSSSMIAPGAQQLAGDLGIHGRLPIAMITSIFVLAYGIGPLILAPLSEIYGRQPVLTVANWIYLGFNTGCGFAQTPAQFYIFRFLAGVGGSAPLSIGGGVLADLWAPAQLGAAMATFTLGPLLGPAIGPIAGGWIAQESTWRWVFWSTSLACVLVQGLGLIYLRETYAPILLERKMKKIQKSLDPEKAQSRQLRTPFSSPNRHWTKIFYVAFSRPFALFFKEPILMTLGIYMTFVYGLYYLVLTIVPDVYAVTYGQKPGIAGLNYLALGIGVSGASQANARLMDKIYKKLSAKEGKGRPEFRLPAMFPGSIILPMGLLVFGWTSEYGSHWAASDVGLLLLGAGIILSFLSIQTYAVDAFRLYAASAIAAIMCCRSLAGFCFPLFAPALYNSLGYGKGNTVLAAVGIAIGVPAPWLFWKYGQRLREMSKNAVK